MPNPAPKPCNHPGCPQLQPCSMHQPKSRPIPPQHVRELYDERRGTSTARGYGVEWRRMRKWFLAQTQCTACGRNHAYCEVCQRQGRRTLAAAVDHIRPHRGDRTLFWDHNNLQGICTICHNRKSFREGSGVYGSAPPLVQKP